MENSSAAPQGRFKNPALLIVACAIILGTGFIVFDKIEQSERDSDKELSDAMQGMGENRRNHQARVAAAARASQAAPATATISGDKAGPAQPAKAKKTKTP